MNANRRRWIRGAAAGALALGLGLAAAPGVARAQEDAGGGEEGEGRSLDGYFVTGILAALAVFIVGKSARR